MNKLIFVVLALFSFTTHAGDWVSPIDAKYLAKDQKLFSTFSKARDILDSWKGEGEDLTNADSLLKSVLQKDRNFAPAYREYGRLYIMSGYINNNNFQEGSLNPAEAVILKSIEIEPSYADAYVLLGYLYTNMQRYSEAQTALEKAREIGTQSPWLELNWADLLITQNQYDEALKRYQHVVDSGTSYSKAYISALTGLEKTYCFQNQFDKANEVFKKQIQYDPNSAWTWGNYSSFLLIYYQDVDGAIKTGQKAISLMDYGMGRFTLASALYTKWALLIQDKNQKNKAQQYFDRAWTIYPQLEDIIEDANDHENLKITAIELQKWLAQHPSKSN